MTEAITKDNDASNTNNNKPLLLPQIKCALSASFGLFICGGINGWSGSSLTKLDQDFKMEATEYSLVTSAISYGALLGTIASGKVMDILGRKRSMLASAPLIACGWLLIGAAKNIYFVYAGRFTCGLATGLLFSSTSIYTSETCQPSWRGRLGSINSISLTLGILASYTLGGFLNWRVSALLFLIPDFFFFLCLCFIPESPYWYLLKGKHEEASRSLTSLRGSHYNVEKELEEISLKISHVGSKIGYKELFKRRTFFPLLIALFIQSIQQFSGGNVLMMYTSRIFEKADSSIDPQLATVYTGIAQLIGVVISLFIIDKYGRRILLVFSVSFCGLFITIFGVYFLYLPSENPWPTWCPLAILLGLVFTYCIGCRSIPWLIGSELFNTSVRSRANSVTVFYNRVMNLLVVQVYPYLVQSFGESKIFFTYGVICFLFAIGTLAIVPETKGKSLAEIQSYFEERASQKRKTKPEREEEAFL